MLRVPVFQKETDARRFDAYPLHFHSADLHVAAAQNNHSAPTMFNETTVAQLQADTAAGNHFCRADPALSHADLLARSERPESEFLVVVGISAYFLYMGCKSEMLASASKTTRSSSQSSPG